DHNRRPGEEAHEGAEQARRDRAGVSPSGDGSKDGAEVPGCREAALAAEAAEDVADEGGRVRRHVGGDRGALEGRAGAGGEDAVRGPAGAGAGAVQPRATAHAAAAGPRVAGPGGAAQGGVLRAGAPPG